MRQIKLQELHKQIEELTSKVSSLQSENASLFSRTNILEKVLDMRNEQIQVMHETKEVRMPGQGRAAHCRQGCLNELKAGCLPYQFPRSALSPLPCILIVNTRQQLVLWANPSFCSRCSLAFP